jgi:hypothetical protein
VGEIMNILPINEVELEVFLIEMTCSEGDEDCKWCSSKLKEVSHTQKNEALILVSERIEKGDDSTKTLCFCGALATNIGY